MRQGNRSGRWVSYIFRYADDKRCENVGFIKVQKILCENNINARIQIGMKLYKNIACVCKAYFICKQENIIETVYFDTISFPAKERDTMLKQVELAWDNPTGSGKTMEEYDGILFVCQDGELFAGMWNEYEWKREGLEIFLQRNEKDLTRNDNKEIYENIEDESNNIEIIRGNNKNTDNSVAEKLAITAEELFDDVPLTKAKSGENGCEGIEELFENCQRLPLFPDSPFVKCVKIAPQDIGRLPVSNWCLGENSFLIHSYYNYRYIMLGTISREILDVDETKEMKDDYINREDVKQYSNNKDLTIIGVPGVYTSKERYVAKMFGFDRFVPVRSCEKMTGKFGYWILEVSNV